MLRKIYIFIKGFIWTAIAVFLVLIGATFIPIKGNYKIYTVQSGSMEPAIHVGNLIFVKSQKEYNVGDIVTRATSDPKVTVTHRIISKKTDGPKTIFETKGDANDNIDGESTNASEIIGKKFFQIPLIGYAIGYARTMPGFILLVVVPAVVIVYEELLKIKEELARLWKKRRGENKALAEEFYTEVKYARETQMDNFASINFEVAGTLSEKRKKSMRKIV